MSYLLGAYMGVLAVAGLFGLSYAAVDLVCLLLGHGSVFYTPEIYRPAPSPDVRREA